MEYVAVLENILYPLACHGSTPQGHSILNLTGEVLLALSLTHTSLLGGDVIGLISCLCLHPCPLPLLQIATSRSSPWRRW